MGDENPKWNRIEDREPNGDSGGQDEEETLSDQARKDAQLLRLGWIGRIIGASDPRIKRDIALVALSLICASVLHGIHPENSVLLPIVTAVLGFIAGRRSE